MSAGREFNRVLLTYLMKTSDDFNPRPDDPTKLSILYYGGYAVGAPDGGAAIHCAPGVWRPRQPRNTRQFRRLYPLYIIC